MDLLIDLDVGLNVDLDSDLEMKNHSSARQSVQNLNFTIGIVGVRGYVGRELLRLLAFHSSIKVDWVSSRQLHGCSLADLLLSDDNFEQTPLDDEHYYKQLKVETLSDDEVALRHTDIIVLALPNGLAKKFVDKLEAVPSKNAARVLIDLSADYRFDSEWEYSIPELLDSKLLKLTTSKRLKISNPGCYATAMQIALAPLIKHIDGRAHCFGVSGFSGAGTKPSVNNDPNNLKNNILPYGLVEHLHEKEVSRHLGIPISFSPHVAPFFRGLSMTVQVSLNRAFNHAGIVDKFERFYKQHELVVVEQSMPSIQQVVDTNNVVVGGFSLSADGKRLTLVSCLDNLLKGAASQALANIELALKLD